MRAWPVISTDGSFAQGLIQVRHCTDVQQGDLTRLGLSLLEHEFVTAEDAARADREEDQRQRRAQDHGPRGALLQCFTPVAFHTILSEL